MLPTCESKKQAHMVCLNLKCEVHAFFCSSCEPCKKRHLHPDIFTAVRYEQFACRVLQENEQSVRLSKAVLEYKAILARMVQRVDQFVKKQTTQLRDIVDQPLIVKLKKGQFQGITGEQTKELWDNASQANNNDKKLMTNFILAKMGEIEGLIKNFQQII